MRNTIRNLMQDRRGATAIEYGLIAAFVAVAIIAGLTLIGGQLKTTFNTVGNQLQNANAAAG